MAMLVQLVALLIMLLALKINGSKRVNGKMDKPALELAKLFQFGIVMS
jgi:hypothetical protein